jgi:hypothetical protein
VVVSVTVTRLVVDVVPVVVMVTKEVLVVCKS